MTVKAELQFVTDAGSVAAAAADNVARFRSELIALSGLAGKGGSVGPNIDTSGALQSQAANVVALQVQGANQVAAIRAQAAAHEAASQHRIAEQYQKDRNAILVAGAAASNAQQASELAHRHRIAEVEKRGVVDAQKLRIKGEEDRARIAAKAVADQAKQAQRASLRAAGPSKLGAAADSLVRGGGVQGAADSMGAKVGAAVAIGALAVGAAKKVADLSAEFGRAVVEAQAFKEDIYEAFKTVRGTTALADKTFQTAIANADKLGIKRADSIATFLDLATKGFDDAKIKEIQGRLLDITTIDPRASVEGLTKIIGKVAAQGRLTTDILSELSTAGLEQGDVIREIGKRLGKKDVEVIKMLSSNGGIRGLGVDPILSAIAAQTGGGEAGDKAAAKANRNLSSLIRRVGEIPQNILFDVEVGPGLDGIKGILKSILDFFASGSETAKNASRVIGDAFNALISGLTGKDIAKDGDITSFLSDAVKLVETATPAIKAFGGAVRVAATSVAFLAAGFGDFVSLINGDISISDKLTSDFKLIEMLTGFSFDGSSIITSAINLGGDIVDGLIGGIKAKLTAVANIASSMGATVISSVRGALDSHSPSRELIKVGLDAGAGLAIGGERGASMVASSFTSMAMAGMLAAATVAPLPLSLPIGQGLSVPQSLGASTSSPIQFTFAPVINVSVPANADGDAIADAIERRIRELAPDVIMQFLNSIGGPR